MPQSLTKIYIHTIFSTKDRQPFFTNHTQKQAIHAYLAELFNNRNASAILVGGISDHVHILHILPKTETVSQIIAEVKRASSLWIKKQFPQKMSTFQWQRGYGAFSVSKSAVTDVKNYIRNQDNHHATVSFKKEFRAFLKKHEVEYDENYVWD